MPSIKGKWLFKGTPVKTFDGEFKRWSVQFRSNNNDYDGLTAGRESDYPEGVTHAILYDNSMVYSNKNGWFNENLRTIDFGTAGQEVVDDFFTYITTNANNIDPHAIEITKNSSTTYLATQGKFCEKNIAVNVNIDETPIYDSGVSAGRVQGHSEGYNLGKEEGSKDTSDAIWKAIQDSGKRTDYSNAFNNSSWTQATFKPLYPFAPTRAVNMFSNSKIVSVIEDGIYIDTSSCTSLHGMFISCPLLKSVGDIDTTSSTFIYNNRYTLSIFGYSQQLESIGEFKLHDEGDQVISDNCFVQNYALKEITFSGKVGDSFSMKDCKSLSYKSILSIVKALKELTPTDAEENFRQLKLHPSAWGALTEEQKAEINELKPGNWSINTDP